MHLEKFLFDRQKINIKYSVPEHARTAISIFHLEDEMHNVQKCLFVFINSETCAS